MGGRGGVRLQSAPRTPYRISAEKLIEEEFPDASEDAPVVAFAEKVEKTLKYRISNTVRFEEGKIPTLLAQFQEHEIQLYRPSEVKTYKSQQIKKVEKEVNSKQVRAMTITGVFLVTSIIALLLVFLFAKVTDELGNVNGLGIGAIIAAFVVGVCLVFWLCWWSEYRGYRKKRAAWNSYSFDKALGVGPFSYKGVIPESTLQLMLSIKDAIPKVEFKLSALEVGNSSGFDPIVYAYLEEEREFKAPVAIWEEPGFHGRLIDATNGGLL